LLGLAPAEQPGDHETAVDVQEDVEVVVVTLGRAPKLREPSVSVLESFSSPVILCP